MRSIEAITADQTRLQKQMGATMNSKTMSGEDIRITLEGFAIQKIKLDEELNHVETTRNIEVKETVAIPDQSRKPQDNSQQI